MAQQPDKLKLGKGAAFVKSGLKRLRQEEDTWEADFRVLPKPIMQSATHYLGMVVTKPDGFYLAELKVEHTPSVNDLAILLANAMEHPPVGRVHRPSRIHFRKNPRWTELFPHLEEIGIEVGIKSGLSKIDEAFKAYLRDLENARHAKAVKPTAEQARVDQLFPAIAQWVQDGHIEIGDQEGFGLIARAIDYGGQVFEDDKPATLAEAMAALEKGLRKWFEEQGIEVE